MTLKIPAPRLLPMTIATLAALLRGEMPAMLLGAAH